MDTKSGFSNVEYIEVPAARAGQRLDNFLSNHLHGVPRTVVYRLVRTGQVRVNKGRVKPSYKLQAGDRLRVPPVQRTNRPKPNPMDLQAASSRLQDAILLETEDFIAVNKPSGLAVHGGTGLRYGLIEVFKAMRPEDPELELVHRLDRETSGCLLLAKHRDCLQQLHGLLRNRRIEKRYVALLKGIIRRPLSIDSDLVKQKRGGEHVMRVASVKSKGTKAAYTYIEPLRIYREMTLAEVRIDTGRTHQIRAHCASIEQPLAGDKKYGERDLNKRLRAFGLNRLFLHASGLRFKLDQAYNIDAPLPDDLTQFLATLDE